MKRKVLFFGVISIIMVVTSACVMNFSTGLRIKGNGNVISQERAVEGFNSIALDGVAEVNVHFGESYRLVVRTDSDLQDIVETTVKGNILSINQKKETGSLNPTDMTIDVYMPVLKKISLSGVGNLNIISGNASELEIIMSGVGNINAQNFQVQNAIINMAGVGTLRVWATDTLNGKLSGVGNVLYKGNPSINVSRHGVGRVRSL